MFIMICVDINTGKYELKDEAMEKLSKLPNYLVLNGTYNNTNELV